MKDTEYRIKYKFSRVNMRDPEKESVAMSDILGIMKENNLDIEVVEIDEVFVFPENRGKGVGTKVLKDFCESYDDSLILVVAGALMDEYPEEPSDAELMTILDRVDKFYTGVGFIDVNEKIGHYQQRRCYIYNNKIGQELLGLI